MTTQLREINKKLETVILERNRLRKALGNIIEADEKAEPGSHEEALKKIAQEAKKHLDFED